MERGSSRGKRRGGRWRRASGYRSESSVLLMAEGTTISEAEGTRASVRHQSKYKVESDPAAIKLNYCRQSREHCEHCKAHGALQGMLPVSRTARKRALDDDDNRQEGKAAKLQPARNCIAQAKRGTPRQQQSQQQTACSGLACY